MSNFFDQFFCEEDKMYSIIIEDDTKVAYAYLLKGENVVSDVWLYNSEETPKNIDWNDIDNAPFLNPSTYANNVKEKIGKETLESIDIQWSILETIKVKISLKNGIIVVLEEGKLPGWSNNVIKSGPLALKLEE